MRKLIVLAAALSFAFATYRGYRHLDAPRVEAGPVLTATRTLPVNWRLQASDLKYQPDDRSSAPPDPSNLAGKYFIGHAPRAVGMTVKRNEIADRPVVAPQAGRFMSLVSIKEQPELLSILNAGSTVALCADTCVEGAQVAFVWCAGADDCLAAVSLSEEQRATFKQMETFRLFLQGTRS